MNRHYTRVVPRDFFNEAKLLNCLGHLSLRILDHKLPEGVDITMREDGKYFMIALMEEGSLYCTNYDTYINDKWVRFKTTYNSKRHFPFFCEYNNEEVEVFDDITGEFTEEFIQFAKNIK